MERRLGNHFWYPFTPTLVNYNELTPNYQRTNLRNRISRHQCPITLLIMILMRRQKWSKLNSVTRSGEFSVKNFFTFTDLHPTISAPHESQRASNSPLNYIRSLLNNNLPLQPPHSTLHLSSPSSQLFIAIKSIPTAVDLHSAQTKQPSPDQVERDYDDM